MQYTAECQGVFTRWVPFRLRGKIRCGIFSRSLMSNPGGVNLKGWTIHSTVPFPMLEKRDTVLHLSRTGVGPEIYLSAATLDRLTPEAAGEGSGGLRAAGIATTTVHPPLHDLLPG